MRWGVRMSKVILDKKQEAARLQNILAIMGKDPRYLYKNKLYAKIGALESDGLKPFLYDLDKCYGILGLHPSASLDDVKDQFLTLSAFFYDDKNTDTDAIFLMLGKATKAIHTVKTLDTLEQEHDAMINTKKSGIYMYFSAHTKRTIVNKKFFYSNHRCLLALGLPPDTKADQVRERYNYLRARYQTDLASVGQNNKKARIDLIDEAIGGFQYLISMRLKAAIVGSVLYTAIEAGFGFGLYKYSKELSVVSSAKNITLTVFFSVATLLFLLLVIGCALTLVQAGVYNSKLSEPSTVSEKPHHTNAMQDDQYIR